MNACLPLPTQSFCACEDLKENLHALKFNCPRDIYEAMRLFPHQEIASVERVLVTLRPEFMVTQSPCSRAFDVGLRWYLREAMVDCRRSVTFEPLMRYLRTVVRYPDIYTMEAAYTQEYDPEESTEENLDGSLVLVHPSGRPIDFWHVLALDRFLAHKKASGCRFSPRDLSEDGFREFWDHFKISEIPEATTVSDPWALESALPFEPVFEVDLRVAPDVVIYRKGLQREYEVR